MCDRLKWSLAGRDFKIDHCISLVPFHFDVLFAVVPVLLIKHEGLEGNMFDPPKCSGYAGKWSKIPMDTSSADFVDTFLLLSDKGCSDTISANIITEMRGADLIVFRKN